MNERTPRERRVIVIFAVAATLVLAAVVLWVSLSFSRRLPAWPWLKPVSIILAPLAVAIPVLGSLFSDIMLPLSGERGSPPAPTIQELRDWAPLQRTTANSLLKGLGLGGTIPSMVRGLLSRGC